MAVTRGEVCLNYFLTAGTSRLSSSNQSWMSIISVAGAGQFQTKNEKMIIAETDGGSELKKTFQIPERP